VNKKNDACLIIFLFFTLYAHQIAYAQEKNFTGKEQIFTDPRVELVSIVLFLTHEKSVYDLNSYETPYVKDIENHFSSFSNHNAVMLCEELLDSGFNANAPIVFALYHTNPPQFMKELEYSERLISRAKRRDILEEFANELRDFAVKSNMESFYKNHHDYYQSLIQNVTNLLRDRFSYREILEDFYGESKYSYRLILAPLIKSGGYGPQIITNDKEEIYCIMGPQSDTMIQKERFGDLNWNYRIF